MKASELIQLALDTKYARYEDGDGCFYMCTAISSVARDNGVSRLRAEDVKDTFMDIFIEEADSITLHGYLCRVSEEYKVIDDAFCEAAFQIRCQWWRDHIKSLQEKGM